MRLRSTLALTLLLTSGIGLAQTQSKKSHSDVPSELTNARWVFLTSYAADGGDYVPHPESPDLDAISDVRQALRDWGYYKEVNSADAADLVIAVRRKGGPLGGRAGTGIDITTNGGVRINQPRSVGGPAEDAMSVFGGPHGSNHVVIWKRMRRDGLRAPKVPLVSDLRAFVESGKP
jgi:hypothetical protein